MNFISINIFSWAQLQPNGENYDFSLLDQIIDMLDSHRIHADLATATAAPPAWLRLKYLQSLSVDKAGIRLLPDLGALLSEHSGLPKAGCLVNKIAERYQASYGLSIMDTAVMSPNVIARPA